MTTLSFDNRFTRELRADPETANFRRQVPRAAYSRVDPTPVAGPELVAYSREMADTLGLTPDDIASSEFAEVFAGNQLAVDTRALQLQLLESRRLHGDMVVRVANVIL